MPHEPSSGSATTMAMSNMVRKRSVVLLMSVLVNIVLVMHVLIVYV